MSDTSPIAHATRQRPEVVLIGAFAAIAIGIFLYFSSQQQQQLRNSATGMDGLQIWLAAQGQDAQSFAGGWTISAETLGLLVTPLYDSDLTDARTAPKTQDELLMQQDEYDLWEWQVRERASLVQTMVVLPKWRSGVRLTGLAHPDLLIDGARVQGALHDLLGKKAGALGRIPVPFSEFGYQTEDGTPRQARLYVAQVFEGHGCDPIIGDVGEMVMGICPLDDSDDTIIVLSDPDLLNNHGLRMADNALIARDIVTELADSRRVLIDYSQDVWITRQQQVVEHTRSWSDFKRFFAYPFSVLWAGGLIVLFIAIWRGGLRYGPIMASMSRLSARKEQAIGARAKLMRMTGQDGALLHDYVTARISALSSGIFGPAVSGTAKKEQAFVRHARRQNPALAENLVALIAEIRALPAHLPASAAINYVEAFELMLEHFANDT